MSVFIPYLLSSTALDGDASKFLQASGITGQNEIFALNNLVINLKNANLWNRYQIIYPLLGPTATTQKWNLKNPQDTNAAYRITFVNGGTFNNGGYTTNGTNQYANTNLIGTSIGTSQNNFSISYYCKNAGAEDGFDFGTRNNTYWLAGNMNTLAGQASGRAWNNTVTNVSGATTGLYTISRTTSTTFNLGVNNQSTATQTSTARAAYNLYFGAYNDFGTVGLYNARNFQFFAVGSLITPTENTELISIVQNYQFNLNR